MRPPDGCVLDASALLAYLFNEPGAGVAGAAVSEGGYISIVNYAEVLSVLVARGEDPQAVDARLKTQSIIGAALQIVPMVPDDALTAARLRGSTRPLGRSLADRVCLATALRLSRPVLTADRIWARLSLGLSIHLIR